MILAGGKGTRLKPFTTLIPKPLVPLGGEMAILEVVIRQLAAQGFSHITIAVNHMANLIMAFFGDGARWGITIDYSLEDQPLGTIGPLTLIRDLPDHFLVMNGDILCDISYRELYQYHVANGNDVSVAVYKRDSRIDFGVLEYDRSNAVTAFIEKPTYHFDVSMGIYCISRAVIEQLPANAPYGFDELMIDGITKRQKLRVWPFAGFWLDIGRPDDYDQANERFPEFKKRLGLA